MQTFDSKRNLLEKHEILSGAHAALHRSYCNWVHYSVILPLTDWVSETKPLTHSVYRSVITLLTEGAGFAKRG